MYDKLFINHTNTLSMVCKIIILCYIKNLLDLIEFLFMWIETLDLGYVFFIIRDKFGGLYVKQVVL